MTDGEQQKGVDNRITAVGELYQYFLKIDHFGRMAERSMEADEATLEEVLAEDLTNE